MEITRIAKIMDFILEIDKAKLIFRRNFLADASRRENDAEHSWHISLMACLLEEFAIKGTDINKTVKMLLIHDLVEIYAGDTYCYDLKGNEDKAQREIDAAQKLFGILPDDIKKDFHDIWIEFEERSSKEAKFANICDRIQPFLLNHSSQGKAWIESKINKTQVLERMKPVFEYSKPLGDYCLNILNDGVEKGYIVNE